MISGPRIVAIDDNVEHLEALQQGFDSMGGHCVAIEYSKALTRNVHFRTGVRLVFMDINLLPGSGSALGARTFDPVVVALRRTLCRENGPVRTDHVDAHAGQSPSTGCPSARKP